MPQAKTRPLTRKQPPVKTKSKPKARGKAARARGAAAQRIVLLTDGLENIFTAKTAISVIRYCPERVACILDPKSVGLDLPKLSGIGQGLPIVATLKEALAFKPNTLLIGIAPTGGKLPERWLKVLKEALAAGLDLVSGLHTFLNDIPELARIAQQRRRKIWDVRVPPSNPDCAKNLARTTACKRVLTVGSDCNLGKMTVSLELTAEARRRGWDAEFLATGQTGIMIAGFGVPIDRTISDFTNGAAEKLVLDHARHEILFIEGQGSINHPAYSAVTLGLLHGTAPDALILCHHPLRKVNNGVPNPIPPLPFLIRLYQDLAGILCPAKVVDGAGLTCCECGSAKEVRRHGRIAWLPQPRLDAVLACAIRRD
jgi:uncharacterized NAD-dependent epimerase/dehydratase family protein